MLAVVTSYYNPAGYARLKQNYLDFCQRMALAEANLFAIEADFQGEQVYPHARVIRATRRQILWQKERIINLAVQSLPSQFDCVAWIDADLLFLSKNWQQQIVQALQKYPAVQCFSHVHKLDSTAAVWETQPCGVASADGAPGFAWAARRELLDRCRLYDRQIAGSGDILALDAWRGRFASRHTECMNPEWRDDYLRWARSAWRAVAGSLGWIEGGISFTSGTVTGRIESTLFARATVPTTISSLRATSLSASTAFTSGPATSRPWKPPWPTTFWSGRKTGSHLVRTGSCFNSARCARMNRRFWFLVIHARRCPARRWSGLAGCSNELLKIF